MSDWRIIEGDCRESLRLLDAGSAQTCVTSPPYFGLRDYGHDGQIGLEPTPDEFVAALVAVFREVRRVLRDDGTLWLNLGDSYNAYNGNRGTASPYAGDRVRVGEPVLPSGHGLMVPNLKPKDLVGIPWMVAFALRADGWYLRSDIIWSKPNPMPESVTDRPTKSHEYLFLLSKAPRYYFDAEAIREGNAREWNGPNGHTGADDWQGHGVALGGHSGTPVHSGLSVTKPNPAGRNRRSVWTVSTQPFPGAHFATFPPKLIEPCILAGSSPKACGECGAPWRRITAGGGLAAMARSSRPQQRRAAELAIEHGLTDDHLVAARAVGAADVGKAAVTQNGINADATWTLAMEAKAALAGYFREFVAPSSETLGWEPSCSCVKREPCPDCNGRGETPGADEGDSDDANCGRCDGWGRIDGDGPDDTGHCVVLDPFTGSGTTGVVAGQLGRDFVGCELSPEYAAMARDRITAEGRPGVRKSEPPNVSEGQLGLL